MTVLEPENFTAVAMCPHCNDVAVHSFRLPKPPKPPPEPGSPLAELNRHFANMHEMMSILSLDLQPPKVRNPPAWASVIRQCACGAEWCQA